MPAASTAPDGRVRILMLNYEFPPLGAGGSTSSFNLARNVVALGHEVDVVTGGERRQARFANTFADVAPGELLVYEDSYRSLAVAVNRGSAAEALRAQVGTTIVLRR